MIWRLDEGTIVILRSKPHRGHPCTVLAPALAPVLAPVRRPAFAAALAPVLACLLALLVLAWPLSARADQTIGDDAMPGLFRTDTAEELPGGLLLALSSGYGFSGETLDQADSHHRGIGRLAASYRALPALAIALRFDGRYDRHFGDDGRDDGWVGDPRLIGRYRRVLTGDLSAALQIGFWAPGSEAPSIEWDALSVESTAALSYRLPQRPYLLSANLGYRLDRSAASVSNGSALSLADRMSLGVSDFDAILFGLGVGAQWGKVRASAEWSLDLLRGSGAPSFRRSPMRVGASMQLPLTDDLDLVAHSEFRLSKVSASEVGSMLVPFDPSAQLLLGVQMRFGGAHKAEPLVVVDVVKPDEPTEPVLPPALVLLPLRGQVQSGTQGVANARITLVQEGGESRELVSDEAGNFSDELVAGPVRLVIEVEGFEPKEETIVLAKDSQPVVIYLDPVLPPGQLRGQVRSYRGRGLLAELRIMPAEGQDAQVVETGADGAFEIDLPPGDYEVTITVKRFKEQVRKIHIEEDGVTIMNVDLRR